MSRPDALRLAEKIFELVKTNRAQCVLSNGAQCVLSNGAQCVLSFANRADCVLSFALSLRCLTCIIRRTNSQSRCRAE